MLVGNYCGWNLSSFIRTVSNHIINPRIVNASSANGESVQMGRGDADFYVLGNIPRELCYDAIFISGVGQDHTDEGNGFWNGLDFLEKTLG